jgi:dihydroflavonol-4-reductase
MDLITGGTGLIGSHLLYQLVREGKPVKAIRRSTSNLDRVKKTFSYYSSNAEEMFSRITWVEGDLLDLESLSEALDGIERVYHCAAMVSFAPEYRNQMMKNNVSGTANVVNACLEQEIKKLCFVSSTVAIGYRQEEAVDETLIWKYSKYRSAYSVSKYRSEMEVWRGIGEGLHAVIVNPSIVIGPGDWDRSSSTIFKPVWKGLHFYTCGMTGYVDVWDVVQAMISLMESTISGERFILSSENLSYREVFTLVAKALDKKPPERFAPPFLTGLAWRIDWLVSKLLFRPPEFTKETARSAHHQTRFSNKKTREAIGITFKTIEQSISETANIFLEEHTS